ncbi:phage tail sheath subtilisin-like domain-containing protein [Novosphingobium colocasiae]|uniref:Tail sheath protein n=1 Tax=Novosphingobium colocasiae TaxID=1256513 RepID=A0A918UFV8_9SPHN|nr:phage tail sheath subtilisin-like domain-containing protein [Novosphingobium colocasiae]GGZ02638.1 tail sheath protein [Novosphingobium colocasiae]
MHHGLTITDTTTGARSAQVRSTAIIGLIATASAAVGQPTTDLNAAFPLNTPVLVTDVDAAAGKAGTGGTLAKALEAIGDQCSPIVNVLRVPIATGEEDQDDLVIAGIQALMAAESVTGQRPRILGAPGLDTQAVSAELAVAAARLRGFAYVAAIGDDIAEAVVYRDEFGARDMMLFWPDVNDWEGCAIADALGLRAKIDEEQGWHKTISNVPLGGVTSITKSVHFDLLDPSTDAGVLNAAPITTMIRRQGYRFWGQRTCAGNEQPEFSFESAVRTRHALVDLLEATMAPFLDQPMTVGLIKDCLENVNAQCRQLKVEGRIVGAEFYFDRTKNSAEQLAAGRPTFGLKYTPCAPLENPIVELINTAEFYDGFADQLV